MKTKSKVLGWATALLPALVLSCQNPIIGGPSGPTTSPGGDKTPAPPVTDNGNTGVTGAPAAPAAPGVIPGTDERAVPPSQATLDAVQAATARITPMTNTAETRVVFVNCAAASCNTRLEAQTLASLRNLLQNVSSAYEGRISFVVREHMGAYGGHSYHADVVLGTEQPMAVPLDENVLVGVN